MELVSEAIIDFVIEELEEQNQEERILQLEQGQPAILAYILSDNFQMFTEEEKDYILFLALTICLSVQKAYPDVPAINESQIEKAEELNWDKLSDVKASQQRERWTPFFIDYPQEDLLAFVEDALEADEESQISKEARDVIFISMKSVIDALTQSE